MIPTLMKCHELQDRYNMMSTSKIHAGKIRDISLDLVSRLKHKGYNLDEEVMEASALLHDITKVHQIISEAVESNDVGELNRHINLVPNSFSDIYAQMMWMRRQFALPDNVEHAESGCHLLTYLGYGEIGGIIRRHNDPIVEISERAILCYSDRIVSLDIVPLEERFRYIYRKYGDKSELYNSSKELERLLLSTAGITFEELERMHHG